MPGTRGSSAVAIALLATAASAQSLELFHEDFETDLSRWNATGLWHRVVDTDPCASAVAPFPGGAGAARFGDPLDCSHGAQPSGGGLFLLDPIPLPAEALSAQLRFTHTVDVDCEGCMGDYRQVLVSGDGGQTYDLVAEYPFDLPWTAQTVDLTPYLGGDVRLFFEMVTSGDFGPPELGWILDEVSIEVTHARSYCTGKTNSLGCVPFVTTSGVPRASGTAPSTIAATDVLPGEAALILYSFRKSNLDFHGGKLCVKAPVARLLPPKVAKATGTPPCTGLVKRDFNALIRGGNDPLLTPGQVVHAQWRPRDPADPFGFGDSYTDAVRFVIAP